MVAVWLDVQRLLGLLTSLRISNSLVTVAGPAYPPRASHSSLILRSPTRSHRQLAAHTTNSFSSSAACSAQGEHLTAPRPRGLTLATAAPLLNWYRLTAYLHAGMEADHMKD